MITFFLSYYKAIIFAVLLTIIGGFYIYSQHLKSEIAEQKVEIATYETDINKLVKEIEFRKQDKEALEYGVKALQENLESTRKECERHLASTEQRYRTLLNRKFTETKKLIDKGAIDEKSSQDFIKYLNSNSFAN